MIRSGFKSKLPPARPATQWTADELPGARVPSQPLLRVADGKARLCIPLPKRVYLRSEPYRRWVASLACAHCQRPGPTQAAHSDRGADGKGLGIKADDSEIWPGCADGYGRLGCHSLFGSTGLFKREHGQALTGGYIEHTQRQAINAGAWPKDWPMPDWFTTQQEHP